MATKKKTTEIVEDVQEAVVEEKPKAAKKSKAKKVVEEVAPEVVEDIPAAPVVEEPVVEEVAPVVEEPAAPVVEEVVEKPVKAKKSAKKVEKAEVVEEPKVEEVKVEAPNEAPATEFPYAAKVNAGITLTVTTGPSVFANKAGSLQQHAMITVYEQVGNFARIGSRQWVNINFIEKL